MVYLDTNVLIYASVEQDKVKKEKSLSLIEKLVKSQKLVLSTLVLQEFVFTMAKLKIDNAIIKEDSDFYFNFVSIEYDYLTLQKAIESCCSINYCKNINDVIHLHLAEKAKCKKLMTYDSDFKKLEHLSAVAVEVL